MASEEAGGGDCPLTGAVDLLERFKEALRASVPVSPQDAALWLRSLERWRSGQSLDEALELRPAPVREPQPRVRFAERDALLRAAADRFFPNESRARQAHKLAVAIVRYREDGGWRRGERAVAECPARLTGTLQEVLWQALKLVDRAPGVRHLERILAGS